MKFKPKLTGVQKNAIFEKALNGARTCDLAKEFNVSEKTIQEIKYDLDRLNAAEKRIDSHQRFARLRIHKGAMKSVEKEHEILDRDVPTGEKGTNLLYLQHQVATSFMDRDGLKAPDKTEQKLEISFTDGNIDVGMPERNDDVQKEEDL